MAIDIGLGIAIFSSLAGVVAWYRSFTRSQYSHEREYSHILKNLEQASATHQEMFKELDGLNDRLSRLEVLIIAQQKTVQYLSAKNAAKV